MLKNKLQIDKYFSQILLLAILIVLVAAISFKSPYFLTWKNWRNILDTVSVQVLLALGMNLVIATGGIDLSQGAVVSLSGIVMALCLKSGIGVGAAIAAGIITAVILGALNGFII